MVNRIKRYLKETSRRLGGRLGKFTKQKGESMVNVAYDTVTLDSKASSAKKAVKGKFVELEALIKSSFTPGLSRQQAILKLREAYGYVAISARVGTQERA